MIRLIPAPRRAPRPHEWTRGRMVAFLRALAASRSVAHAARSVGLSRQSAYRLRWRLAGTAFDEAWALALGPHPGSFVFSRAHFIGLGG